MREGHLIEVLGRAAQALAEPGIDEAAMRAAAEHAVAEAQLPGEIRLVAGAVDVTWNAEPDAAQSAFVHALSQCLALARAAAGGAGETVLDVHGLGHELERVAAAARWREHSASVVVFEVAGLARGPGSLDQRLAAHVGSLARATVRQDDAVGNLGAGQFALLLPRAGNFEARAAWKRVREAIHGNALARAEGLQCGPAGFAELAPGGSGAALLAEARAKMLEARRRQGYRRPRDPLHPLAG